MAKKAVRYGIILTLACVFGLAFAAFPSASFAQPDYLEISGEGTTSWNITAVSPDDNGTKTVYLRNVGDRNSYVTIWISDITETDRDYGVNDINATLGEHLLFNIACARLNTTTITLPTTIYNLPQDFTNQSLNISPLGVGDNLTLVWEWEFNETGEPQDEAQGDSLSFTINYILKGFSVSNGGGGWVGGGSGGGGGSSLELVGICSPDGLCCLLVAKGTVGFTAGRDPLETLILGEIPTPAAPTPGCLGFTKVYDAGPHGATFKPQITILFYYNESKMPQGVTEGELAITTWNETADEWIVLESSANTTNNTVMADISHFTPFTILTCAPSPPNFIASELSISPPEVYIGEEVLIGITIINTGELTGRHEVVLNINDEAVETKEVTLATGFSRKVTFTVTEDATGTYHVTIDGQTGKFDVLALPLAWVNQNWWLIWLLVIAVGAVVYFRLRARRKQWQSPEEVEQGE